MDPLAARRERKDSESWPRCICSDIADDLRAALEQIEDILGDLQGRAATQTEA